MIPMSRPVLHIIVSDVVHVTYVQKKAPAPLLTLFTCGRKLDLKAFLKTKKCCEPQGYKKGALAAFSELEQAGLGNILKLLSNKFGIVDPNVPSCALVPWYIMGLCGTTPMCTTRGLADPNVPSCTLVPWYIMGLCGTIPLCTTHALYRTT